VGDSPSGKFLEQYIVIYEVEGNMFLFFRTLSEKTAKAITAKPEHKMIDLGLCLTCVEKCVELFSYVSPMKF